MRKILALNFFPAINPPTSGGEMRYLYLYKSLSKYFDITLLSTTSSDDNEQEIIYSETFREYRIPRHKNYNSLYYSVYKEDVAPEISGLISIISAKEPQRFHEVFLDLQKDKDLIIHDHPYMFFYDLTAYIDGKPRIYNAYNVERAIINNMWSGKNADKYKHFVENAEKYLIDIASLCFASSEEDIETFKSLYNVDEAKLRLVPNGIELSTYTNLKRKNGKNKKVLFIGSLYPPNIKAAKFIIDVLAKELSSLEFIIAGSCSNGLETKNIPSNVKILGKINEEEKLSLLQEVSLAINPVFEGGGSNLKMLEYMAASIPIVSTPIGTRGLSIKDEVLISSHEDFSKNLKILADNEELSETLSKRALEHVKKFSWDKIAERTKDYIEEVFNVYEKKRKTIMVLNDFPVSEAVSGGEIRINRLYSNISKYYDVALYCFSKDDQIHIRKITDNFTEISIPKTKEHLSESAKFAHYISADDIVNFMLAPKNKLLSKIVELSDPNYTILSHPYMASLLRDIKKKNTIYESLNAEFFLKRELLKSHPHYMFLLEKVEEAEKLAINNSKFVISVSKDDVENLKSLGAKEVYIVPNGTDIGSNYVDDYTKSKIKSMIKNRPFVVFIGSGHPPNVEALKFILEKLAPAFPNVIFGIMGSVCYAIPNNNLSNVIYFGVVDDVKKQVILELADVGLNPIFSGSGSNLKIGDYFSKKLAVITTEFGARGYNIKNRVQAIISNIDNFKENLGELLSNSNLRKYIAERGYCYAKENLDWKLQAELFRYFIDEDIKSKRENELVKQKLIIDISFLKNEDWNTGIHRVVKSQLKYLREFIDDMFVYPAFLSDSKYYYASFKAYSLGIDNILMPEYEVNFNNNDILYMPDFTIDTTLIAYEKGVYNTLKEKGVKIVSFVHDILPIKLPKYFPEDSLISYKKWIKIILTISDKIICNSESTANDLKEYINILNLANKPYITYLHLGSDISSAKHSIGINEEDLEAFNIISKKPYFLMVSTIEPRKGHRQVLKAFEILWRKGYDFNLVFAGKQGWMVEDFINYIQNHPEKDKRLFWLGHVSDDLLEILYKNATATIMASEGEGFGLSIIESAYYKTPIIARDIPVFREIAKDGAYYFPNTKDEKVLADSILDWYKLYKENKHPKPDSIKWMSWKEHAEKLKEIILS